jgi:hypothetical protein
LDGFFIWMKFRTKYFVSFLTLLAFSSCFRFGGNKKEIKEVPFTIVSKSDLFSDKYFTLRIDSSNNYLKIRLEPTKNISSFPFPKDQNGNALSASAFTFSFCVNGQCIKSASLPSSEENDYHSNYFGYNQWVQQNVHYTSDTMDIRYSRPIEFEIPLYAFNKLKRGNNNIELHCRQDLFCSPSTFTKLQIDPTTHDSSYRSIRNYARSSLVAFTAKFDVDVPQIFKTAIYGYGIELRNDSVYSPAGMDNTIWNSSYPDVYWTISFPGDQFYSSSDYQKSTGFYDLKDTFYLYHYSPNDSITLGVWDHDNLSRDDYIAYKRFSLNTFPQNKTVKIPFGNIKAFELKVIRDFAVNR